jgi:multiple sugar transport system substrate-binding protein
MRKTFYIVTALVMTVSMLLAACGTPTPAAPAVTDTPAAVQPAATDTVAAPAATDTPAAPAGTDTPAPTVTPTQYPIAACGAGKTCVNWFIGLGTGTDPVQLAAEQAVTDDFNADPARAQDKIQLIMNVVPYNSAKDTILTEIAAGNGPDIIGPIGWNGSISLGGQFLDLTSRVAKLPKSITGDFDPALLAAFVTSAGVTEGLPFSVYPSAFIYNVDLFTQAGIDVPPADYAKNTYKLDGKVVPWNWDTVKAVAQKLTVDAAGKNATEAGFDKTKIVQYGFSFNFETQPSYVGAFMSNGGAYVGKDGKAQLPKGWVDAWKWFYDGMYGDKPYIPNGSVSASADFGNGNVFDSGKVAMIDQPAWYLCCLSHVKNWELGTMPVSADGKVAGRIDADTFRILKGTKVPDAAFTVLVYFDTVGVQKLIIGSADGSVKPAYGAVPARAKDFDAWLTAKKAGFPTVKNWALIKAGLSYPDSPNAEAAMPDYVETWALGQTFYNQLASTPGLDLPTVEAKFLTDLQALFDKK